MVIEVITWSGAKKKHAINQDWPHKTLCGAWIPKGAVKDDGYEQFPDCMRCADAVMHS